MLGVLGTLPGFIEGGEAGMGIEGLQDKVSIEVKNRVKNVTLGKQHIAGFALMSGVLIGTAFGEGAAFVVDGTIGDGGVGYLPALAVGGVTYLHNRANTNHHHADKTIKEKTSRFRNAAAVALASFAAWEGMEAGFLTNTGEAKLHTALAVTGAGYIAGRGIIRGTEKAINKISPKAFYKWGRTVALAGPVAIAGIATPELLEEPKAAGIAVAGAGVLAVGAALKTSLFPKQRKPKYSSMTR